jgi:putative ABC transport system permease protein
MNLYESIKSAVSNVLSNKMRSMLTMLGIIIGVASVIIITSIGEGSTQEINEQFDSMGTGNLNVSLSSDDEVLDSDQMTLDDVDIIMSLPGVKYASPVYSASSQDVKLVDPQETQQANITGVNTQYLDIESATLLYGRNLTASDIDMGTKVVIINDTAANAIFGSCGQWVIGEKISLKSWQGTNKYTVVGITEDDNAEFSSMYGDNMPLSVLMPVTTAMQFDRNDYVSQISVTGEDPETLDALANTITSALSEAHNNTDMYNVQNLADFMDQITSVLGTVTLMISSIAGISLLVGGIGVMNIMLVTVTERTREIGIRKSIGAKNRDIRAQFVVEAIIITAIGGMIGVLLGWGGGNIIGSYMDTSASLNINAVIIAVLISTCIGIIFGVYPANKAARLDPIEALRYE